MGMGLGFGAFDERINLAESGSQDSLSWGAIISVNTQDMTMWVEIATSGRKDIAKDVSINNAFTNCPRAVLKCFGGLHSIFPYTPPNPFTKKSYKKYDKNIKIYI